MSRPPVESTPYRDVFREYAPASGAPAWREASRLAAFHRFHALGWPTRALEAWRRVDLAALDAVYSTPCEDCLESVDKKMLELYFLPHAESNRLVFVNGIYSSKFSQVKDVPEGAVVRDLPAAMKEREAIARPLLSFDEAESDAFAALNAFSFTDGALIHVPDGVEVKTPVHLLFVSVGHEDLPPAIYPRVVVSLGRGAKASVVANHVELTKDEHLTVSAADLRLGPDSKLDYTHVQRSEGSGTHFSSIRARLDERSTFDATSFTHGGALNRLDARVRFQGAGAAASLNGLTLLDGVSQSFVDAEADHAVPGCTSRQFFKSVLAGRARSEFSSLVHVRRGAEKSDSRQLNRNLILSAGAQAVTKPELKIFADDVQCAHGATVGQLQKEELFYLRSRGLSESVAKFVLTYGFAEEIVETIGDAELRGQLEALVRARLEDLVGGEDADRVVA